MSFRHFTPFAVLAVLILLRRLRRPPRRLLTRLSTDDLSGEFDFVIVGGGTAGCVLAARLSEHAHTRVLLIEAGQSSNTLFESRTPAAYHKIAHGTHAYNLYTEPQIHAANQKNYWPRARLLGGCSAINAQMAQYGAPSDYDEFATIIGDDSWSWGNFERYFRKFEKYNPDPRFPHVDASLHGSDGPVTIGYHAHTCQASPLFVQACVNAGIPFSPDFTTSNGTLGVNKVRLTYVDSRGKRVSAESAYLTPDVLARPNLKVLTLARVTKIIFDSSSGTPRAVAVEYATSKKAIPLRAKARKEVIVCGGAVHTPQILLLSGVGPSALLKKYDIPVVVDSPGVGANLSDHPQFSLKLGDRLGVCMNYLRPYNFMSSFKFFTAVAQYKAFGTGPLSSNLGEMAAFFRIDDQKLFPPAEYDNDIEDSTSGPNAPDVELIFAPLFAPPKPGRGYTILVTLLRPTSVGNIQIKSTNPWDDPVIDPNYLATQHDVDVLVRGVRVAYRIAHTAPLSKVTDVESSDLGLDHHFNKLSDGELAEVIKSRIETIYHPYGTCTMGKDDNPAAVLDTQMKVRGTLGLRVCDASIYPKLVSGHTAASVFAAAEKLADILKAEYVKAAV